jgi:hypothetical protein
MDSGREHPLVRRLAHGLSPAEDEAPPDFSACLTAIQNRPPASTMTIAAATHGRILDLQIMPSPPRPPLSRIETAA